MTGDWKPGDVGISIAFGYRGIFISGTCPTHDRVGCWHNESGFADPSSDGRRPAVVIDPEDRQAVERLSSLVEANGGPSFFNIGVTALQAALREFAAPTPPRPNEPQGLGAVVEDADGRLWLRDHFEGAAEPRWFWAEGVEDGDWLRCDYSDIDVVRVLSEGIEQP